MADSGDTNVVADPPLVPPLEQNGVEKSEESTAGENGEAMSVTLKNGETSAEADAPKSQELTVGEILACTSDITTVLPDVLESLGPYRHLLPESLTKQIDDLADISLDLKAAETAKDSEKKEDETSLDLWSTQVRKLNMQQWQKRSSISMAPPWPVVEAYYGDPDSSMELTRDTMQDNGQAEHLLQRIFLRSMILCNELEDIASMPLVKSIILPPPFKFALHFLPQIEARVADLDQKLADLQLKISARDRDRNATMNDTNNTVTENIGDEPTDAKSSSERSLDKAEKADESDTLKEDQRLLRTRVEHLKCFRDFIRTDLKQSIELRSKVQDGTLETISFRNLWHLFKPGDVIVSKKSNHLLLHKVYSVTGGQRQTQVRLQNEEDSHTSRRRNTGDVFEDSGSGAEEDAMERILRKQMWGVGTWIPFKLDCFSMESNGNHVGPLDMLKKIKYYSGEKRILDLDVYPVRFHPDSANVLRSMEERGRTYLKSDGHRSYDGFTLPLWGIGLREELQGDIFIDIPTYLEQHSGMTPKLGELLPSSKDSTLNGEILFPRGERIAYHFCNHQLDVKLTETFMSSTRSPLDLVTHEQALELPEYLQLMPRGVMGYVFSLRQWRGLEIESIANIDRGREARGSSFADLVIPDNFRELLVGLVENHASRIQRRQARQMRAAMGQDSAHIDLVRGKGQGLIILLHGPPGSGKTSTAETIAAYTQRPLYSITCGDLGLDPVDVEESLQIHTKNADRWGCVLLLDEADVFLMQRNWQNVERNALVSVLLRQLEYYSGILFLTTNRPGVIDEAFLSRIHISLRYQMIDLPGTKRMWTNIMNRIERDNETSAVKVVFDRKKLLVFAEKHYLQREKRGTTWNGRQIRNAFQIAIALGISQRMDMLNAKDITPEQAIASGKKRLTEVKLTKANLKNISQTSRAFEDYMQHLRGNDSVLARQAEVRDDHYDLSAPRATKDYGEREGVSRRIDSFGTSKSSTAAKASANTGKSRQTLGRKSHFLSDEEDSENKSDSSESSADDESDEY